MYDTFRFRRATMRLHLVVLSAALTGVLSGPGLAQDQSTASATLTLAQFVKEHGGTERINLSAKLRMLSQRIPAVACVYAARGDDELAKTHLNAALDEFEKIAKGLEFGDDSLGMFGPEESAKALKGLKILGEEWAPLAAAARDLLAAGGTQPEALAQIYAQEPKVLEIAKKLAVEIGAIYTDPNSLTIGGAMTIDIAGRQRMLLQKMTKEACQISTGGGTADTATALQATVDTFDKTLAAMIDGLPEAGMPPAPTPEIRQALETLRADWQAARAPIDGVMGGTALDAAALAALMVTTDGLVQEMNKIVAAYSASATF
ncbi:MAG: type IV pili methyl-accepting chemotaxis transducer N-terminal domain-containing protein [Tabrizicola sp.]|jgi:hypothetical protein|nr:type IV pili methyl-accepting chemotaxis transducer N-terminal domain-containing protein [Tabrizicola sp.]